MGKEIWEKAKRRLVFWLGTEKIRHKPNKLGENFNSPHLQQLNPFLNIDTLIKNKFYLLE